MKQTNVEKGNVRKLMLSLTIEEKKGYEVSKKIAKRFLENKVQYKFFCSKYSAGYRFDDFYIKVFYPKYEKGKVEVVVYKNTKEVKRVLDIIMDLIAAVTVESDSNKFFLHQVSNFSLDDEVRICGMSKKVFNRYSIENQKQMYNFSNKISYNLAVLEKNEEEIKYRETIIVTMHISAGVVVFVPNLFSKIFEESEKYRKEIIEKIEKI